MLNNGVYYYGKTTGTFDSVAGSNAYGGKCCLSNTDAECTGNAAYKDGPNSGDFKEPQYAIAACPVKTDICGERKIILKNTKATAVDRII